MLNRILFAGSILLTLVDAAVWVINASKIFSQGSFIQKYAMPVGLIVMVAILIAERSKLLNGTHRPGSPSALFLFFLSLLLLAVIVTGL